MVLSAVMETARFVWSPLLHVFQIIDRWGTSYLATSNAAVPRRRGTTILPAMGLADEVYAAVGCNARGCTRTSRCPNGQGDVWGPCQVERGSAD